MDEVDQGAKRRVTLPGRGSLDVREWSPRPDAPALFLLHGLGATGLLNWRTALEALARDHRVILLDHRGHGGGIRIRQPFRLVDCADDVAALADVLGIERYFVAGYSMGGPIAQLAWRRHPDRVRGLVLCATAFRFASEEGRRLGVAAGTWANAFGRIAPRRLIRGVARNWLSDRIVDPELREWILAEVGRSDPITVGQAAAAVLRFDGGDWVGEIDVPVSVLVTELDRTVPVAAQRALAERLRDVEVHPVAGDHSVCVSDPERFVPGLVKATESVVVRAARRERGDRG